MMRHVKTSMTKIRVIKSQQVTNQMVRTVSYGELPALISPLSKGRIKFCQILPQKVKKGHVSQKIRQRNVYPIWRKR